MLILYGLKSCDTCRKARRLLDSRGAGYRFHDLRVDGLAEARVRAWADQVGWEVLLNRRSTAWRRLPQADKASDAGGVIALMTRHPELIKRPVLEVGSRLLVGFHEAQYQSLL